MPVEQLAGARMVRILRAGPPPALPDLFTRAVQDLLVGRVLPLHQVLDNLEQSRALFLLRLLGREQIGLADGSSTICAKITREPPLAGAAPTRGAACSVPMADRLLPRRGDVDRFQWQGDLDQFLSDSAIRRVPAADGRRQTSNQPFSSSAGRAASSAARNSASRCSPKPRL